MVRAMSSTSDESCDPTYGKVDTVLELITKSKSLHILMILDRAEGGLRFGDIKSRVEASSTTVSRRLKELEHYGLVQRKAHPNSTAGSLYALREDAEKLSPIMQSLFDWAETWNVE